MKRAILPIVCVIILSGSISFVNAQKKRYSSADQGAITKTIQTFWTALGTFDSESMKQTFDWPVTIVETSKTQTTNPQAITSPAEFDEMVKSALRPASGRSDFFGIVPSSFSIQLLNNSLAHVTYTVKLPARNRQPAHSLNAVAILRKQGPQNWKIIFITVPK